LQSHGYFRLPCYFSIFGFADDPQACKPLGEKAFLMKVVIFLRLLGFDIGKLSSSIVQRQRRTFCVT
jgi:hypothetical protein